MMTAFESLTPSTFSQPLKLKQWTVADYHRMAELNLLRPGERTELLEGQISLMAAKGTAHVLALRILSQRLEQLMAGKSVFISTQDPIQLNDFSEPEPDLAIIYGNFFDFSGRHPQPKDIALVVEIADSSVKQDCEIKDKLYGKAGIVDYWVVDLPKQQLHVFRKPSESGYEQHLILSHTQTIAPLSFANSEIVLSEIFQT